MKTFESCKQIEKDFKAQTLSFKDFEKRLAYVALESIDELRIKQEPTPPEKVQQYHILSKEEQRKADEDGFWREGVHWAWLEESKRIWGLNRGNLARLIELKRILEDDPEALLKISKEIKYYSDFIRKETERAKSLGVEILEEQKPEAKKDDLSLSDVQIDMIDRAEEIFDGERS